MTGWPEVAIEEVMDGFFDGPHATPKPSEDGPIYLGIRNMTEDGLLDLSTIRHIAWEDFPKWVRRVEPQPGDVVFTYEASLHRYALIPAGFKGCLGRRTALIRPNTDVVDARFLLYQFLGPRWRAEVNRRVNIGSTVDRIPLTDFPNFPIHLPPLSLQRKIAAVLAAYDELIENNLRRIETLEEMAQAVYREWFVEFRYPGHETAEMVDSPLGRIPEGWRVAALGDVLATLESGSRPKGGIDPEESAVPSIGAENILGLGKYDFTKEKYISEEFFGGLNRGVVESGDVLLYKDGAKLGRKSLFRDGFPHEVCAVNEHVFILRSNHEMTQSYLYFWLDLPVNTQRIVDLNSNAAQPGISQPKVRGLPIMLAPTGLISRFDAAVEPMMGLLFNLARQNVTLRATRDLLLPRLVSGELDVSDLDIDTEWLVA